MFDIFVEFLNSCFFFINEMLESLSVKQPKYPLKQNHISYEKHSSN
jgi:thiamine pyrophosphokinase